MHEGAPGPAIPPGVPIGCSGARPGTDLRFLLGPGVAVRIRSNADLGPSDLDGLIALVPVQRDVLARAATGIPKGLPALPPDPARPLPPPGTAP